MNLNGTDFNQFLRKLKKFLDFTLKFSSFLYIYFFVFFHTSSFHLDIFSFYSVKLFTMEPNQTIMLVLSRNNGEDNDAAQDGMDDEDELENKKVLKKYPGQDSKEPRAKKSISEEYSRITGDLSRRGSNSLRENTPDPTDELTFIGKFKKAIKDHPKPLRNMNTWEPQSF